MKLGLRRNSDEKQEDFVRYFDIVQNEARKQGKVFFLDGANGYETEFRGMQVDCLTGWLLEDGSKDFEKFKNVYLNFGELDDSYWDEKYYCRADYEIRNGKLRITFV